MTNQPVETGTSVAADADQPAQSSGKPGRPSLAGSDKEGSASPQIAFRVNPTLRQRAQQVAESEGINVSQLSRKALKEYLAKK
jgi:hypothetical protein